MVYPMKVVVHKTGLTPETLRAWERRYDGIQPGRDSQGRRVYSEELMEKLVLLSILVDQGYRIGELAGKPSVELRSIVDSLSRPQPQDIVPNPSLESAEKAVLTFDTDRLWGELERATTVYGRLDVVDDFVFPLTHQIKARIASGNAKLVHLGFVRSSLRTFLSTLLAPMPGEGDRPRVLIAYPRGQRCDLGAVASAVHCHAAGWHPVLLGMGAPAEEIVEAAYTAKVSAVIMAGVTETYETGVLNEMVRLRRGIREEIPVLFGGNMPRRLVEDIEAGGLRPAKNMKELRQRLKEIAEAG